VHNSLINNIKENTYFVAVPEVAYV
jgi:hypothetical protein